MPEPMHMLVQMMRAPERFASERAVAIWRAPCSGVKRDERASVSETGARREAKVGTHSAAERVLYAKKQAQPSAK